MFKINFEEVAKQALSQSQMLVTTWLPGGKLKKNEYIVKNPTRADQNTGSFVINIQTGVWSDFATNDNGMNLIALYAYLNGIEYINAANKLAQDLGMTTTDAGKPESHYKFGKPTAIYHYDDNFYIYRFDLKTGDKEIRPMSYDGSKWKWQAPKVRPLYNLSKIIASDKPVVFCEGEKAADAAVKFFPNHIATTTSFGAKSPAKTDFSPIAGKVVLMWRDNDVEGQNYANNVAQLCIDANAKSVHILQIPNDKPIKFDADDCQPNDNPADWMMVRFVDKQPKAVTTSVEIKNSPVNLPIVWTTQDGKMRLLQTIDIALVLAPSLVNTLIYDDSIECWLYYKNNFWNIATPKKIFAYVNKIILNNRQGVGYGPGTIKAVIEFLEGTDELQCDRFDEEYSKELIPMQNGILNINTLELHQHSSIHRFRYILPFNYDARAKMSPVVNKWLDELCDSNDGKRLLLQATLNRVIKGKRGIQMFTCLIGEPGSGKGTFTSLAQALVGNQNVHPTTLDRLALRFENGGIYGKKLVVVPDSRQYIEDLTPVNSLVAEDLLTIESKGKNFQIGQSNGFVYGGWTIVSGNKAIKGGNHLGLERREVRISINNRPKIADTQLLSKLTSKEALSGIFNWCMTLTDEQVVDIFLNRYEKYPEGLIDKIESLLENDHFAHFLDETYQLDQSHTFRLSVGKAKIQKESKRQNDDTTIFKDSVIGEGQWLSTTYLTYCVEYSIPPSKRVPINRLSTRLIDVISMFSLDIKNQRVKKARFITGLSNKTDDLGIFSQLFNDSEKYIDDSEVTVKGDSETTNKINTVTVVTVNNSSKNSVVCSDNSVGHTEKYESAKNTVTTVTANNHADFPLSPSLSPHCHGDSEKQIDNDSLNRLLTIYGDLDRKPWAEVERFISGERIVIFIQNGWLNLSNDDNETLEFPLDIRRLAD